MASRRQNLLMLCKLINFWLSWPSLLMGDMQMAVEGEPGQKAWAILVHPPRAAPPRMQKMQNLGLATLQLSLSFGSSSS